MPPMKNTSRSNFYISIICFITICTLPGAANAQSADEMAIRLVLQKQINGWNNGNIDQYMKGYWESDSLMVIGKNGPKRGYKSALENYKKSYPDTAAMGKLGFNILQLKRLSPEYYHITGQWTLKRSIGNLQGYFTLLFRKIKNTWLIVSDHSS